MQATRSLRLANRDLELRLSKAAHAALAELDSPLVVEMELYFSCLIRKRVRILSVVHPGALCVSMDAHLTVCFRPVMTRKCELGGVQGQPELEAFPIQRPEAFVPKWLALDYRRGAWSGEFSF
jgi:hypothetical protein